MAEQKGISTPAQFDWASLNKLFQIKAKALITNAIGDEYKLLPRDQSGGNLPEQERFTQGIINACNERTIKPDYTNILDMRAYLEEAKAIISARDERKSKEFKFVVESKANLADADVKLDQARILDRLEALRLELASRIASGAALSAIQEDKLFSAAIQAADVKQQAPEFLLAQKREYAAGWLYYNSLRASVAFYSALRASRYEVAPDVYMQAVIKVCKNIPSDIDIAQFETQFAVLLLRTLESRTDIQDLGEQLTKLYKEKLAVMDKEISNISSVQFQQWQEKEKKRREAEQEEAAEHAKQLEAIRALRANAGQEGKDWQHKAFIALMITGLLVLTAACVLFPPFGLVAGAAAWIATACSAGSGLLLGLGAVFGLGSKSLKEAWRNFSQQHEIIAGILLGLGFLLSLALLATGVGAIAMLIKASLAVTATVAAVETATVIAIGGAGVLAGGLMMAATVKGMHTHNHRNDVQNFAPNNVPQQQASMLDVKNPGPSSRVVSGYVPPSGQPAVKVVFKAQ